MCSFSTTALAMVCIYLFPENNYPYIICPTQIELNAPLFSRLVYKYNNNKNNNTAFL